MPVRKRVDPRNEAENPRTKAKEKQDAALKTAKTEPQRVPPETELEDEPDEQLEASDQEAIDVYPEEEFENPVPPVPERGLSVEPDNLGEYWLNAATEQGNFESSSRPAEDGMHVTKLRERRRQKTKS